MWPAWPLRVLCRCGSTPRCGKASSSAASAPSPRASRSSCSCRRSSWGPSSTSAQSSASPCWHMCGPSPPTRYPTWCWGRVSQGSSRPVLGRGGVQLQGAALSMAPLALHPASTHPQLHHGYPGSQWQAGAGGQGGSCGPHGGGEVPPAPPYSSFSVLPPCSTGLPAAPAPEGWGVLSLAASFLAPTLPASSCRPWLPFPLSSEFLCTHPQTQDDLESLALAPTPAPAPAPTPSPAPTPRPPQDLIGLRLAQEKALKRQLEEEKLKPGGAGAPSSSAAAASSSSSSSARSGPPPSEEAMDFREEGPECETPGIFISVDGESGLSEAALLDSSLEGPLPKVEGCPPTRPGAEQGGTGAGRG